MKISSQVVIIITDLHEIIRIIIMKWLHANLGKLDPIPNGGRPSLPP
jgi:hypothetical protein